MVTKVIHAVTVSQSLDLMRGQLDFLSKQGYEVKALCSEGANIEIVEKREGIKVLTVNMERKISLLKDFRSLMSCIRTIRKEHPQIVNAGTPKAGLIVNLAAFICRVPVRIYNVLGLRMETTSGIKRKILLYAEKTAAGAATHLLAVSPSLKDQLVSLGIADKEKITILGKGSVNGFNLKHFEMTDEMQKEIDKKKLEFGLMEHHVVLGFVGRMTKDKGIEEMVESFVQLNKKYPQLRLLIVGDYDSSDSVDEETQKEIGNNPRIIHAGFQDDPIPFYHMMDIFVFLTKREGFGNVSAEAALAGMPVIAANVTGARDTIINGKTGFLVNPSNIADVVAKVEQLVFDCELRLQMGLNGKAWAQENFSNDSIWQEMDSYYQKLLTQRAGTLEEIR